MKTPFWDNDNDLGFSEKSNSENEFGKFREKYNNDNKFPDKYNTRNYENQFSPQNKTSEINLKNQQIKKLKRKIKILKKLNKSLIQRNNVLYKDLMFNNQKIDDLLKKQNELQEIINSKKNNSNETDNIEDDYLKSIIQKYEKLKKIGTEEKLMIIYFDSVDKKLNYPVLCTTNTDFTDLLKELYKKYPEYLENNGKDIHFTFDGKIMQEYQSMGSNGLRGYNILLNKDYKYNNVIEKSQKNIIKYSNEHLNKYLNNSSNDDSNNNLDKYSNDNNNTHADNDSDNSNDSNNDDYDDFNENSGW